MSAVAMNTVALDQPRLELKALREEHAALAALNLEVGGIVSMRYGQQVADGNPLSGFQNPNFPWVSDKPVDQLSDARVKADTTTLKTEIAVLKKLKAEQKK
jgi:hypothetical protein